jgi:hypothetical protein
LKQSNPLACTLADQAVICRMASSLDKGASKSAVSFSRKA